MSDIVDKAFTAAGQNVGQTLSVALAAALQPKITALMAQAREALSKQLGVPASQISDIDAARYLANLPTADLTDKLTNEVSLVGKSVRNAILIGFGSLALVMIVTKLVGK